MRSYRDLQRVTEIVMVFVRSSEAMLDSCSIVMECPFGVRMLLAVLIWHEMFSSLLVTNSRSPFYCTFNLLLVCSLALASACGCVCVGVRSLQMLSVYVSVCVYVCVCVFVCMCVHVCTLEGCLYIVYSYACTVYSIYICIYIYTIICNFVYTHVLVCIDAYVRMYLFKRSVDRSHPSIYLSTYKSP